MPESNEPDTLHLEITDTQGHQNFYTELLMWHKRALRMVIKVDNYYPHQSDARIDIFSGTMNPSWTELATIHWSEMASKRPAHARKPDTSDYAEDRAVLVRKAGMLLGFVHPED